MKILIIVVFSLTCSVCAQAAQSTPFVTRDHAQSIISHLAAEYNIPPDYTGKLLAQAQSQPGVLKKMRHPAEKTMPWYRYRAIFLQPDRIAAGADYIVAHSTIFKNVQKRYGVPPEVISAIIGVETYYGKHTGNIRVLDSLATLAFDYPPRAAFFTRQLEQFIILCHEEHLDPDKLTGSYAGAMGLPQFIPGSYRHYAVDFNDDGQRDLWSQPADIIGSVANYFQRNGWKPGASVAARAQVANRRGQKPCTKLETCTQYARLSDAGAQVDNPPAGSTPASLLALQGKTATQYWVAYHNFYVITKYNRSPLYAMAVYQLSQAIAAKLRDRQAQR